jgi:uncharacterized protein (DUF302 family)
MRPLLLVLLWLLPSVAFAQDELITLPSAHSAPVTIKRLQEAIVANGYTILATIDHAALAAEFGVKIPPRTTIAFAWMPGWTQVVIENPTIAIELPNRVLVWQDGQGVWVTRNTSQYLKRYILRRHEVKYNEIMQQEHEKKVAAMIENVIR